MTFEEESDRSRVGRNEYPEGMAKINLPNSLEDVLSHWEKWKKPLHFEYHIVSNWETHSKKQSRKTRSKWYFSTLLPPETRNHPKNRKNEKHRKICELIRTALRFQNNRCWPNHAQQSSHSQSLLSRSSDLFQPCNKRALNHKISILRIRLSPSSAPSSSPDTFGIYQNPEIIHLIVRSSWKLGVRKKSALIFCPVH